MITFFRGDADAAAELLRSRLNLVLDANPWLAGRLKRQGPGKLNLHVPDAATLEERRPACFCDTPVGDLHPGMRSDEMQSLLSPLLVGLGNNCIDRDEPVFRLVLIRTQPSCFAILLSCSHVIADGHTGYLIYEMLGSGARIVPLEARREPSYTLENVESTVALQLNWRLFQRLSFLTGSAIVPILATKLGVYSCTIESRLIDHAWLDALKARYNREAPPGGAVNTHETLLHWFLCRAELEFAAVALNLRNIAPNITDDHAGHYVGGYLLSREHLDAPIHLAIQHLMQNEHRRGDEWPMPTLRQRLYPKFGIVSNWSTIYRELVLPGCEQVLHMPLLSPMPSPRDSAGLVIFQATKDQLGVFVMGRRDKIDHVLAEEGAFGNLASGAGQQASERPAATSSRMLVAAAAAAAAAAVKQVEAHVLLALLLLLALQSGGKGHRLLGRHALGRHALGRVCVRVVAIVIRPVVAVRALALAVTAVAVAAHRRLPPGAIFLQGGESFLDVPQRRRPLLHRSVLRLTLRLRLRRRRPRGRQRCAHFRLRPR